MTRLLRCVEVVALDQLTEARELLLMASPFRSSPELGVSGKENERTWEVLNMSSREIIANLLDSQVF